MSIEAMKHYEAALLEAFPRGATGAVFEHWNKARQAIEQAEKQEPVAWGVPNTRITERQPFMMLLHSTEGCQYPEMLVPLYTNPQPQQEPVARVTDLEFDGETELIPARRKGQLGTNGMDIPLYAQPRREWVGLTYEEINDCDPQEDCWGLHQVARAIEAKLKEKNVG
jgi:hypothetical protein